MVAGARWPVYGFNRLDGEVRWKLEPFPFAHGFPPASIRDIHDLAACNGIVYVGSSSTFVAAVSAEDGRLLWRTSGSLASADGVSCDGQSVFVMRPLGGMQAIDATTGVERWRIYYPDNDFWTGVYTDAVRVYGGGQDGLYAPLRLTGDIIRATPLSLSWPRYHGHNRSESPPACDTCWWARSGSA